MLLIKPSVKLRGSLKPVSWKHSSQFSKRHSIISERNFTDYSEFQKKYFDIPEPLDGKNFPVITANQASRYTTPPVEKRMLSREFIDDCLYNPNYGYFSKQAVIYSPESPIEFNKIKDSMEFLNIVAEKYKDIEDVISSVNDVARQVWHTPTELFKPWYGFALANYIVSEFLKSDFINQDLIIYEIGAGNGTLMINILDFIQNNHTELYTRTRYRIIEISTKLAQRQQQNSVLRDVISKHRNISIVNQSVLNWNTKVNENCFFIALEVLDNFSHDLVRYDSTKNDCPLQGIVLTGKKGEYEEVYEPVSDLILKEYLEVRQNIGYSNPVLAHPSWRALKARLPFSHSLTEREFVPTRAFQLIKILHEYFPNHRFIMSDFFKLPEAIEGFNGPVVQTRFRNTMVPCSTYLVQPGYFDIFFPTDFELFKKVYDHIHNRKGKSNSSQVLLQSSFLQKFGDLEKTVTKSGENPFLTYYENNKFFIS